MTDTNRNRVCWTRHEWSRVVKEMDRMEAEGLFPANASRAVRYQAAQRVALDKDRWRSSSSFYQPGFKRDAEKEESLARDLTSLFRQAKESAVTLVEPQPVAEAKPEMPQEVVGVAEEVTKYVMNMLPEMLRLVVREELQRLLAGGLHVDISNLVTSTDRRRIDVIGLLPAQVNEVMAALSPEEKARGAIRFYDQTRAMSVPTYSPDVLVCTKFISHGHQDRVKSQGSKVHYINGAAMSAVHKLKELLN